MAANAGDRLAEETDDEELDLRRILELVGFFLRAPRRHPVVAGLAASLTLGMGVAVAMFWPRTYDCDVRILAQRNLVLPALDNPNRAVPHEADNPTKNAADSILRRDNIVALVKQLDLLDRWEATRAPLLRFKDKLFGVLHQRTDDEKLLDMIGLLDKRLIVTSDDSSVTISIQWPDRQMAFDIITLLQTNFLEARYDSNVNVIAEAIRILQERAKPQSAEVDAAFSELTRLEAARNAALGVSSGSSSVLHLGHGRRDASHGKGSPDEAAPPRPAASSESSEERQRVRQLESERERQLSEAQHEFAEASATLGPEHPKVLALKEEIAHLSQAAAEMNAVDDTEHELEAELGGGPARPEKALPSEAPDPTAEARALRSPIDLKDDSKTAMARARLTAASAASNELLSRIAAANIELDVTRAAFKYQYAVVRPPELPRRPLRPNVNLVLVGSLLLAFVLALLIPGGFDLLRGRLLEPWQIERTLKITILGELPPL